MCVDKFALLPGSGGAHVGRHFSPRQAAVSRDSGTFYSQQLVCATGRSVWDAWRLDPYVRGELHTYMCGSSSGVDVVRSAIDRKATTACRGRICSEKWRPARGCRMSETGPMMLNSVL